MKRSRRVGATLAGAVAGEALLVRPSELSADEIRAAPRDLSLP